MSLNAIVRGSRVGKALVLALLLGAFLAWWRFVGDPGAPVEVREVGGVVTAVHEKACVVRLDSGQQVRVFRTVSVEAGARVQLTATKYASGEERFALAETGVAPH